MEPLRLKILLCVDDRALGSALSEAFSSGPFLLTEVETGLEVAMNAHRNPPDMIVASASAPMLPGPDLARRLRNHPRTRDIPVLFLCAAPGDPPALAQAGVPADRCFRTPVDMGQLLGRAQALLMRHSIAASAGRTSHLDGDISRVPLPHLLMTLETTSPSGVLRVRNNAREGHLLFRDGHVLNGYLDDYEGEDALLALLEWDSGTFSFVQMDMDIQGPTLGKPSTLILECLKLLDDKNSLAPHLPDGEEILAAAVPRPPAPALDGDQERILARIDGTRSVNEIVRASGPYRTRTLLALAQLVEGGFAVRSGEIAAAERESGELEIAPEEVDRLLRALAAGPSPLGRIAQGQQARIAVFLASTSSSVARSLREMAGERLGAVPEGPVGRGRWVLDLSPELALEFLEVAPGHYPAVPEEMRSRLGTAIYIFSGLSIPDVGGARHFIQWARTWAPRMPVFLATYEMDPERGLSLWEIQRHVEKEERVYLLPFREIGRLEMGLLVSSAIGRVAEEVETRSRAASGG